MLFGPPLPFEGVAIRTAGRRPDLDRCRLGPSRTARAPSIEPMPMQIDGDPVACRCLAEFGGRRLQPLLFLSPIGDVDLDGVGIHGQDDRRSLVRRARRRRHAAFCLLEGNASRPDSPGPPRRPARKSASDADHEQGSDSRGRERPARRPRKRPDCPRDLGPLGADRGGRWVTFGLVVGTVNDDGGSTKPAGRSAVGSRVSVERCSTRAG